MIKWTTRAKTEQEQEADAMQEAEQTMAALHRQGIGFFITALDTGYRIVITHRYYDSHQVTSIKLLDAMQQAIAIARRMGRVQQM